jgi:hypothetical protein
MVSRSNPFCLTTDSIRPFRVFSSLSLQESTD